MKKAFFYGDSNTYGYDPAGYWGGRYPRAQRWTTILAEGLAGEWEIEADGMPGRVIPAQGRPLFYLQDRIRAEMPVDLFAVMLGTNDILGTLRPDAEKTTKDMDTLITGVKELGVPQILLIAPPEIKLTDLSFEASYVRGDRSYAQRYQEEGCAALSGRGQGTHASLQGTGIPERGPVCGCFLLGSGFCLRCGASVGNRTRGIRQGNDPGHEGSHRKCVRYTGKDQSL